MSMTGNFARGTGCCGTTSVDCGLYSRMVGGGNSGSRPSAGPRPDLPGRLRLLRGDDGERAEQRSERERQQRVMSHE